MGAPPIMGRYAPPVHPGAVFGAFLGEFHFPPLESMVRFSTREFRLDSRSPVRIFEGWGGLWGGKLGATVGGAAPLNGSNTEGAAAPNTPLKSPNGCCCCCCGGKAGAGPPPQKLGAADWGVGCEKKSGTPLVAGAAAGAEKSANGLPKQKKSPVTCHLSVWDINTLLTAQKEKQIRPCKEETNNRAVLKKFKNLSSVKNVTCQTNSGN